MGRKEEEVGTLLLGNDKTIIVNYLFSFYVEPFGTKWLSKGLSKVKDK